jgi:hypothetical protein
VAGIEPPTFDEFLLIETYKEAYKTSISSLDGACDKSVAAAFSLATAYGALLALVAPQGQVHGVAVGLPFAGFAGAALLALLGRSLGVEGAPTSDFDQLKSRTVDSVDGKRSWVRWSVVLLCMSVLGAGVLVFLRYGGAEAAEGPPKHIALTAEGQEIVEEMCGGEIGSSLTARTISAEAEMAVLGAVTECGGDDLWLPARSIRGRATPNS